jgi:inosine/xanthosine triphosphatase
LVIASLDSAVLDTPCITDMHMDEFSTPRQSASLANLRRIAVGSTNPVKLSATRAVLAPLAPRAAVDAIAVASTVRDQPFGDDETVRGARERARAAREALDADLGVGIEGGVVEMSDRSMRTCAWAVIVDREGRVGLGGSLAMPLPGVIADWLREGLELGDAMDRLVRERGTKHGRGAVGVLTAGLVNRQRAYEVLVTYALAPFLTPELYEVRAAPADMGTRSPRSG